MNRYVNYNKLKVFRVKSDDERGFKWEIIVKS